MLTTFAITLAGHLRVAAIAIAAALLGVGGTVAAVANVADSTPSADPSAVTSTLEPGDDQDGDVTEETTAPKKVKAPKVQAAKVKAPKTVKAPKIKGPSDPASLPAGVFDPAACAAAANHGAYVSYVAHATKGMADRGALVSAAAQSDCGKTARAEKPAKAEKAEKKGHKTKADPTAKKKEGN